MKKSRLIKMKDSFCWWDVTDRAESIYKAGVVELYVLYDDDSESLIENEEQLYEAKALNLRIVMELGYIHKKPDLWTRCKRILKDGHWYVKLSDAVKTL
jgi:hypothetical protein